jgi:hypothetical protein
MIVEIPYAYRCTVVPRGCRNSKTAQAWGSVAVRLQVIEGEAAVAAVLRANGKTTQFYDAGDGLALAKTRIVSVDGKKVRRMLSAEKVQGWLSAARVPMGRGRLDPGYRWYTPELEVAGRAEVRQWVDDNAAEAEAAVVAAARRLVVIGGLVYERTPGPVWAVRNAPDNVRSLVAVSSQEDAECPCWLTWRGDRLADALAAAQALNRGAAPAVVGEIEVLRPGAFTWDDDWENLRQAVESFVSDSAPTIHKWPTPSIARWAWLRDRLVAWPLQRDHETFAAVAAMRRAVDRGLPLRADYAGNPYDPSGLDACIRRVDDSGAPAPDARPNAPPPRP